MNSTCPWACSRRTSTFSQSQANTHCKTSRGTLDVYSPPSNFTLRSRRNAASYSLCWGNMSYNFTLGKLLNWELLVWHRSCLRNPMVLLIQRGFERVVMKNIASPFESASRLLSSALFKFVLLICLGAERDNTDPSGAQAFSDISTEHYLLQIEQAANRKNIFRLAKEVYI